MLLSRNNMGQSNPIYYCLNEFILQLLSDKKGYKRSDSGNTYMVAVKKSKMQNYRHSTTEMETHAELRRNQYMSFRLGALVIHIFQ